VIITDLKVHLVDMGRDYHFPAHGTFKAEAGLVRVFTDEGIEGNTDYCTWALPPKLLGDLILAMKPYIIGEDPFKIEYIWHRTFKTTRAVVPIYAPGCINVALWDIVGKALNLPIYRLLVRPWVCLSISGSTHGFVRPTWCPQSGQGPR
jgi:L-alanine-DL-glutamate epimerase-like enolase superfamily enzyme